MKQRATLALLLVVLVGCFVFYADAWASLPPIAYLLGLTIKSSSGSSTFGPGAFATIDFGNSITCTRSGATISCPISQITDPLTLGTFNATNGYQVNGVAPTGDVLCGNGTNGVWCDPGAATSRTDATASVTLNCLLTNDGGKRVVLTNTGSIALTGCTPGVNFPDGRTVFVDVQSSTGVATLTPGSGLCNGNATCPYMTRGVWRVKSDGTNTWSSLERYEIEHVISWDVNGTGPVSNIPIYFPCTIYAVDVTNGNQTNATLAMDVWRLNAGVPAAANKISNTDGPALDGAHNANLGHTPSGWSSVALVIGDVIGGTVGTYTSSQGPIHIQMRCH